MKTLLLTFLASLVLSIVGYVFACSIISFIEWENKFLTFLDYIKYFGVWDMVRFIIIGYFFILVLSYILIKGKNK